MGFYSMHTYIFYLVTLCAEVFCRIVKVDLIKFAFKLDSLLDFFCYLSIAVSDFIAPPLTVFHLIS